MNSMKRAMLSKPLIRFSVDEQGLFPPCYLTWGQTMVEVMKIMATSFKGPRRRCCTQWPQPCSRPLKAHASAGDSWTLTDKSGSVSFGVTTHFSWVLVHIRFCLCPPRVCPQSCVSSGSSMVGLMATSSKRAYAIPCLLHPEPLPLRQSTADPYLHRRHSNTVLAQSLWDLRVLVCTRFVWALWASLAGMEFDSKCYFMPPTSLLGLLCLWTWGISSLQHHAAAAPLWWQQWQFSCQVVSNSCDPVECSLPVSSVHSILQARILDWVAILSQGDLPDMGIKPGSPAFQAHSLPTELRGKISLVTIK